MRKFLTFDGEVLEETEWQAKPIDLCFYCDLPIVLTGSIQFCPDSQDGSHDWITLVNPSEFRR